MSLADLLSYYRPATVDKFQTMLSGKKEFSELASEPGERLARRRGSLYKHQQFVERFLRAYDRLLLIHETGTGKTCSVAAFTEYAHRMAQAREKGDDTDAKLRIKQAIVLVGGPSQVLEFKRQIACVCTEGLYEPTEAQRQLGQRAQKAVVTRLIHTWYKVMSYESFFNIIRDRFTQGGVLNVETIVSEFSDTIFWLDEIHNLRLDQNENFTVVVTNNQPQILIEGAEKVKIYKTIWNVLHLALRCRVILSSATPMINETFELAHVMNLLLAANDQMNPNWKYDEMTLDDFRHYLQGKISYVRALDTGAIPVENGDVEEYTFKDKTVQTLNRYVIVPMSEFQSAKYLPIYDNDKRGIFVDEREASNVIFPDGSFSAANARRYTEGEKREVFMDTISGDDLGTYSAKVNQIVNSINETEGNVFVYSNFLHTGAYLVALALEARGWTQFNATASIFETSTAHDFCGNDPERRPVLKQLYREKVNRFALITGTTSGKLFDTIMEAMNSYENRNGDIIRVLITSSVARDGLNINHILHIHLLDPDWTPSGTYQALSRGIRSTSHIDLINDLRTEENPNPTVEINIYKYVAVPSVRLPTNERGEDLLELVMDKSTDWHMYLTSDIKARNINRVMTIMKQLSVDCQVHYKRNVRESDANKYICSDPSPTEEDITTYLAQYISPLVDTLIPVLSSELETQTVLDFSQIEEASSSYLPEDPKIRTLALLLALESIIYERIPIKDRFSFQCFLREDAGRFYLSRDYPLAFSSDKPEGWWGYYYTKQLTGVAQIKITEIMEQGAREAAQKEEVNEDNLEEYVEKYKNNRTVLANLIEKQLELFAKNEYDYADDFNRNVLELFQHEWYMFPYPQHLIDAIKTKKSSGVPRGRPKTTAATKITIRPVTPGEIDIDLLNEKDTPPVLVHTVKVWTGTQPEDFNKAAGPLRVYWQDQWQEITTDNPLHQELWAVIVRNLNLITRMDYYNKAKELNDGIWGNVYPDGKFRIVTMDPSARANIVGQECTRQSIKAISGLTCDGYKEFLNKNGLLYVIP